MIRILAVAVVVLAASSAVADEPSMTLSKKDLAEAMAGAYCMGKLGLPFGTRMPEDGNNPTTIAVSNCVYDLGAFGNKAKDEADLAPCNAMTDKRQAESCAVSKGFTYSPVTGRWERP